MSEPDPHACARCARIQKTCCQRAEILLTEGDVARIGRHTGRRDSWWSARAPQDPAYLEDDPDDPNWLRYTTGPRGTRKMLDRRATGDCVFLGRTGCTLPTEVRPLVCRLYPFAYTERGITGMDDDYCPSDRLIPPNDPRATMLTVLNMDPDDALRWHRTLYEELRTKRPADEDRPDLRPA